MEGAGKLKPKPETKEPEATPEPHGIDAKQYLKDVAKELHKPVRHKFPTRKVFAQHKDQTWSMDLADMSTWKDENDGVTYVLTIVDVFTRWAAARPLRTKTGREVLAAVQSVCAESERKPEQFWCDEGKEFLNKEMEAWREKEGIGMYHTYGRGKSVIVERFNRTLKTIMWRRLTAENTHAWVAILPQLIAKYNKTKHSVLHMTPNYASKHPEQTAARWAMVRDANDEKLPNKKPRFAVGDVVRVSRTKGCSRRGMM